MRLIRNTASNAAELYKLLGNNNTVFHGYYGHVQVNRYSLLINPAADSIIVYAHDGSEYNVYIRSILTVLDYECN
jgi:hypothetical protein